MNTKATLVNAPPAPTGPRTELLADLTPEEAEWIKKLPIPQAKPTMLHVEVSRRTFDAVKAKPERLVVRAEDADGNAVFEKPAAAGRARTGRVKWDERPLSEAEIGTEAYNRLRTKSAAEGGRTRPPLPLDPPAPIPAGTPAAAWGGGGTDQRWKPKRGWDGETRYVPDARAGRGDEYVVSDYDIFAVLKE